MDRPGFLVREQFATVEQGPEAKRRARERLNLPQDRFLILAMVGAEGSPEVLAHLGAVARTPLDADIMVVCGRNRRVFRRVERLEAVNRIEPLAFVENIADLMTASDVLLTKTGGVTLAEAFCCGVPVVAFDPLPARKKGTHGTSSSAVLPSSPSRRPTWPRWRPSCGGRPNGRRAGRRRSEAGVAWRRDRDGRGDRQAGAGAVEP